MAASLTSFKFFGSGNGQQGYLSAVMPEHSRQVWKAEVSSVDAATSDDQLAQCMAVIKAAHGTTCPSDSTLPFQGISMFHQQADQSDTSKTVCYVDVIYQRDALTASVLPCFEVGTEVPSGTFNRNIYLEDDTTTLADGEFGYRPISFPGKSNLTYIQCSTILSDAVVDSAAWQTMRALDGYINTDAVYILGEERPAQTLEFANATKKTVYTASPGEVKHIVTYNFYFNASTYTTQRLIPWGFGSPPAGSPWNGNAWRVVEVDHPQSASYAGKFPTHGGEAAWGGTNGVAPIAAASWSRPT